MGPAARIGLTILALAGAPSAVLAQDGNLSLGVTAGVGGFYFPELSSGATLGPSLALSGSVTLDPFNGLDAAIGWSGFATFGNVGSSSTETFAGPGVVVVSGMSLPDNSTIKLTTSSTGGTATATATVTQTNPDGSSVSPTASHTGAGVGNAAAVSPTTGDQSFAFSGVTTNGAGGSAAAYGAIGAADGNIFVGEGDLTGLKISHDFSMDVVYTGADVTLAVSGVINDRTAVQVYAGPSYRYLSQNGESTVSIDIPEVAPSAITFPEIVIGGNGELKSHYFGGVVGANISYIVGPNLIFTLGSEGGLYYVNDHLTGGGSATVQGGDNKVGPYGPQTVASSGFSLDSDGMAWAGRVNGLFTMALAPKRQLSFGGSVEYLSRVASLSNAITPGVKFTPSGIDDLTYVSAGSGGGAPSSLSYNGMWNFTGTISLTGQF